MSAVWPDARLTELGNLIDRGETVRSAARRLRTTPGSVSGKASRLGWRFGRPRTDAERAASLPRPRAERPRSGARQRQFSVGFDDETMAEVWAAAERRRVSRCEMIRLLVEWGLEAEDAQ